MTYDIEKQVGINAWSSDGLGEATGWPTKTAAVKALRSLVDLGDEWRGVYRVVDGNGRVVHEQKLGKRS